MVPPALLEDQEKPVPQELADKEEWTVKAAPLATPVPKVSEVVTAEMVWTVSREPQATTGRERPGAQDYQADQDYRDHRVQQALRVSQAQRELPADLV